MYLRRTLVRAVRIAVAVALVGFLAWRAGAAGLAEGGLSWPWVAAALALTPLCVAVRAYNHALLLNSPVRVLSFPQALVLTLVGVGINLFLPTGAADLAKAHWGLREHGNAEVMVVSAVLDKLTSLTAVALMGFVGALVTGQTALALAAAGLGIATLLPFMAPRLVPWRLLLRVLAPKAEIDADLIAGVANPPRLLLAWVYAVSVVGWLLTYAAMWVCLLAVGADIGFASVLALAPVSSIARLVPVSVGGIGVGEATLAALLTTAGVPAALAARGVLLSMVFLVLAPGALGLAIFARGRKA